MLKRTSLMLAVCGIACAVLGVAVGAQAQENFCAMLPQTDVSTVVGSPVKLVGDSKIETARAGGGGTLRSQSCNYDPARGIGSGPATVRVNITEASSPAIAAQMFKIDVQLNPAGKGDPLSGVGDEAQSYHNAGVVYVRKKNVVADIHVGLRDLNSDREIAMAKTLAQKLAARIP